MKAAVSWMAANRYRSALSLSLLKSNGLCLNQQSFYKAALKFVSEHGIDIVSDEVERGVYRFRTIISQFGNMKSKGRGIPRQWRKEFSMILGMVASTDEEHPRSISSKMGTPAIEDEAAADSDDDVICMGTPPRKPVPVLDVEAPVDTCSKDALMTSSNPELQKILEEAFQDTSGKHEDPGQKRKRFTSKSADPAFAKQIGGIDTISLKELVTAPSAGVAPASFAALNRKLKSELKAKKAMQVTKTMKAMK
eukprot:9473957-Pyramimonas_sp.AAC.1